MKTSLPRICFFGCGLIAARHARMLKKLYPKMEISFASRNMRSAEEYTAEFGGGRAYGGYREAASSGAFDIAFITTPHAYHSDLAVVAAEGGRDIIIEKPVTRNLKELAAIERAVGKHGVRCAVAENYFYKPFLGKVREYVDSGAIGRPLLLELNKTSRDTITGWRTDAGMMGGGALLEGGVHWVNALVSLAGDMPTAVAAVRPEMSYDTNIPFEDTMMLLVKFRGGLAGKLLHSWRIPNALKGVGLSKIYGTEGVIVFESNGLFVLAWGRKKRFSMVSPGAFLGFKSMHRAFVEAWRSGEPWQPDLARIKMELKLIEASYRSLRTGKFEKI